MKKYKPILKGYKDCFNKFYNIVQNPNLPRKVNVQNTFNYMASILEKERIDKSAKTTEPVALQALIDDMNGNIVHYFIKDNSLVDFLTSTTVKDYSIVKNFLSENSRRLDESDITEDSKYCFIAVHSKIESHLFAYIFSEKDNRYIIIPFFDNNGFLFNLDENTDFSNAPISRMAINIIYYIKAFPEKIIEGVPNDIVKNDKSKYSSSKTYSIGIADEIIEKTSYSNGHLVSPHFRSGFFRHYTDDRYINMKGKVQFISATMVKGKAKTCIM